MEDDLIPFIEYEDDHKEDPYSWHILIVDDDKDVHSATRFSCGSLMPHGTKIKFFDAYSAEEAFSIIKENTIDLVLLDVVMETPTAGLDLARKVRHILNKVKIPAIILRSGQAGTLTDCEVIGNDDINTFLPKAKATREVLKALFETYLNPRYKHL